MHLNLSEGNKAVEHVYMSKTHQFPSSLFVSLRKHLRTRLFYMTYMIVGLKKASLKEEDLFQPRQSPFPTTAKSPGLSRRNTRFGCCGNRNDCMGLQPSTLSTATSAYSISSLQKQVADLEWELQRQKELKDTYKSRVEQVQEYLRFCLERAKESGFLDLLCPPNNQECPNFQSPSNSENGLARCILSPQALPLPILNDIKNQAVINGWYIEPHEIHLHDKIGEGSTSNIYHATWRGLDVAVKCISPQCFSEDQGSANCFAQELDTLARQRHPFVLSLIGACLNPPDHAWLVTEILMGGTLKVWLHGQGPRQRERLIPLPPLVERIEKGLEIAQAMQYLHGQKPKIIHRDLKPSNIFLDGAMHVRVADFGYACFLEDGDKALTGETGTHVYMAPEVIRCEPYNEKCDIYSFAVILNELISGQYPYVDFGLGPAKIALEVGKGSLRPTLPEHDADSEIEELIELVRLSWDNNPSLRPDFATITQIIKRVHNRITQNQNSKFKCMTHSEITRNLIEG